ncbi:MAG: hypothetical protein M1118_06960 [Chloroflexi bacterium]|nr:hypothetical protein [Chloroflexota bacterium]
MARSRRWWLFAIVLLLLPVLWQPDTAQAQSTPADYDLPASFGAHFFTQTNGGQTGTGFAVSNADGIPFWTYFQQVGGVPVLGYPVSSRFIYKGFVVQAFQKVVLQWRPNQQIIDYVNTLDEMHNAGLDSWLQAYREVPPVADWSGDTGLPFAQVIQRHLALLDANPAIKAAYFSDPNWLQDNGLPMAPIQNMGGVLVLRAQRKVFQQWLTDVPWAQANQVVVANGGDLAKEGGLFPQDVITPQPPSSAPLSAIVAPPPTPSPTPTPTPANGCNGDEQMSFSPASPAAGQQVTISVTSAAALTNVGLSGSFNPQFAGVQTGGKGYVWSWTVTPNAPGQYNYNFTVNNGAATCTANTMQVSGTAIPAGCNGDEAMSFNPTTPAVGQQVLITVTSARGLVNVGLTGPFNPQYIGVQQAGSRYVWTWIVTPASSGSFSYNFTVNGSSICTSNTMQVGGTAATNGCNGDEAMSFNPSSPATGQQLLISVSSGKGLVNVGLSGSFNPQFAGVQQLGSRYVWTWTVTPATAGQYTYTFTINNGASSCASGTVQVTGGATGNGCNGDEAMSFSPSSPSAGQQVTITVTSARPSTYVGLSGPFNPQFAGVQTGGKGYVWSWTVTPSAAGQYNYNFTINNGATVCTTNVLQVQ